eukprot:Sdes_comp20984_c0_seq1m19429
MVDVEFKQSKIIKRTNVDDKFDYLGFKIGEGTYGVVYKAKKKHGDASEEFALKKIKGCGFNDGLSPTAVREISLLRELRHENIIYARQVYLNPIDRDVWLLFDYAEHDLFQIIQHHRELSNNGRTRAFMPEQMVKSLLWQILNGIHYLHSNWVLHRDMKPANILVMGEGCEVGKVKIGDLGMARLFQNPLKPLADVDPVVVTIWYRAPELLLNAKHYTKAIDMWAIGCIFAELITTKPIFHGQQVEDKSKNPFQKDQLEKIFRVTGFPTERDWPTVSQLPDYPRLSEFNMAQYEGASLWNYMQSFNKNQNGNLSNNGFQLLAQLLSLDPSKRISAESAMKHGYFKEEPMFAMNSFLNLPPNLKYPKRTIIKDDKSKSAPPKKHKIDTSSALSKPSDSTSFSTLSAHSVATSFAQTSSLPSKKPKYSNATAPLARR